jgi:hypothetical protein
MPYFTMLSIFLLVLSFRNPQRVRELAPLRQLKLFVSGVRSSVFIVNWSKWDCFRSNRGNSDSGSIFELACMSRNGNARSINANYIGPVDGEPGDGAVWSRCELVWSWLFPTAPRFWRRMHWWFATKIIYRRKEKRRSLFAYRRTVCRSI